MQTTLLVLSYIGKLTGFIAALHALPFVSASTGFYLFFGASLLKDSINRLGDFLDNQKEDQSWQA